MGGTAFLIHGRGPEPLEETPRTRGLLERLLRRRRPQTAEIMQLPDGTRLFDASSDRFDFLGPDFRDFLKRRFPRPWESTKAVMDYLEAGTIRIYLRGERGPTSDRTDWFIQVTFSGCAGLAETSAEIAAHWALEWYRQEQGQIEESLLGTRGFVVDREKTDDPFPRQFMPFGDLGYGLYVGGSNFEPDPEYPGSHLFEIDAGHLEREFPLDHLRRLRKLDELFGDLMTDGQCLCQMCAADFNPPSMKSLGL